MSPSPFHHVVSKAVARQERRVPLQPQAIQLLKSIPKLAGSNLIFPSRTGKALSDMAFSQLMRGMRERGELTVEAVPHGFRSTFRDRNLL